MQNKVLIHLIKTPLSNLEKSKLGMQILKPKKEKNKIQQFISKVLFSSYIFLYIYHLNNLLKLTYLGLPFKAKEKDLIKFFEGKEIK